MDPLSRDKTRLKSPVLETLSMPLIMAVSPEKKDGVSAYNSDACYVVQYQFDKM